MKLSLIILSLLFLASCWMSQEEKLNKIKECDALNLEYYINNISDKIICAYPKKDKVQECIENYIDAIDEKYNNPDIVTDLREDDYSNAVKTCNETFWITKTPIK